LLASAQVGRPFIASHAVPPERVRILRDGFNATMQDPQFIAEAQKLRLPMSPKTGEEALQVVESIYATPEDIVAAARKVVAQEGGGVEVRSEISLFRQNDSPRRGFTSPAGERSTRHMRVG